MASRASATRYARALLQVVITEQGDVSAVADQLDGFAALLGQHDELRRGLIERDVPGAARAAIVREIATRQGFALPLVKLLVLLAERHRLELVPDMAGVFRERVLAHRNVVIAHVASAVTLTEAQTDALAAGLSKATGATVQIDASVDPSLIGGVVARVGSTVYDGSIRTQMQKIRQQLVDQA